MEGASSRQQVAEAENATFFTKEELNILKSDFERGGMESVKCLLKRKVEELDQTELNIAVMGEAGAGKSTFIDAMRGLRSTDPGAAEVGIFRPTMEPTGFPHPNFPKVQYWNLPGIGSTQFPACKYLKKMKFEKYDFFIIISACRFKENEVKLAREIKRLRRKFYFVRSKIDIEFGLVTKGGLAINEEIELECIRNYCCNNLRKAGIQTPSVFLISSFEQDRYDFNRLTEALEADLPNAKKRIFVMAYPNRSVEIIQKKKKILQKRIWMLATLSGAVGAVPVPGLSAACDIGILIVAIIHFRKCLGLDEASLQRLANITNIPVEELKAKVKVPLLGKIDKDTFIRLGCSITITVISNLEVGLYSIPVLGSIFGAGSSFLMTYKILTNALKDLTENTETIMKIVFDIN
ncbi:interferon-inducible GTPase 5-like isoform X2 [Hemitrygon akajei]|uniref:interferon-inducible GTPase 5-like isoform X2 n=1 Tax=Hemitrygon akajei TaxID=2704970 RepID=UPI003BF96B68